MHPVGIKPAIAVIALFVIQIVIKGSQHHFLIICITVIFGGEIVASYVGMHTEHAHYAPYHNVFDPARHGLGVWTNMVKLKYKHCHGQ